MSTSLNPDAGNELEQVWILFLKKSAMKGLESLSNDLMSFKCVFNPAC